MSTGQLNPIPPKEPDKDPDQATMEVTIPPEDGGPLTELAWPAEDASDPQGRRPPQNDRPARQP
jgi:hypothetical protein